MTDRTPIDFAALAAALLDRAETLVPQWLPGGRRHGAEWVCGSLSGEAGRSCSINLKTGRWADFSGDTEQDSGGDLISLYAAIHDVGQAEAARELMEQLGWRTASDDSKPAGRPRPRRTLPSSDEAPWGDDPPPDDPGEGRPLSKAVRQPKIWRAIVPVPPTAPPCDFWHWHYTRDDLERSWEYRYEGVLYGHVGRFRTSEGKLIVPYTWCVDESDGRGTMRWHSKQFPEPRPLYVPATLLSQDASLPVVLVEGEKCAEAGHQLLGHEFDFVSWPGGGNAWQKADWRWLEGRTVYLWPDADSQREKLTKDEREKNVDRSTKPLLPAARQPGMRTMVGIGSVLMADHRCKVYLCPIPKPGEISDGWDIADAIEQGWDVDQVRGFIRGAVPFVQPDDAARAKSRTERSTPSSADAKDDSIAWRGSLVTSANGSIKPCRENVVLALDGMDGGEDIGRIAGVPEAAGCVGFNEFTNNVEKLKPAPWGTPAGVWDEVDELLMGEWLVRQHWLPPMPRAALEEAVRMVAKRHAFHPLRQQYLGLRDRWDGTPRLGTWLRRCCLEEDEWDDEDPLQKYLARVGTWLVMAMVARVLTPGCKFDYMVIFEGPQGVGKSTLASVLGGEYYADTGLVLGDKDSYQNLQGIAIYEMGELDALNKSDITKIKLFISSQKDRFRASFDRRPKDYPRQVVFIGTTNEDHYLSDPTGNRRMWPVKVTRAIDLEWLRANREQLFAEALLMVERGDRFHPNNREQRELFEPQQQLRVVENAIEGAIVKYLYDDVDGRLRPRITIGQVLGAIGIDVAKLGPGRFHEKQAAAALKRLGWRVIRPDAKDGQPRTRQYERPEESAASAAGASTHSERPPQGQSREDPDDIPF